MGKTFEIDGEAVKLTPDQEKNIEQVYQDAYQLGLAGKRKPAHIVVMSKYSICYNYEMDLGYAAGLKAGAGNNFVPQPYDLNYSTGLSKVDDNETSESTGLNNSLPKNDSSEFFFHR